MRRAARIDVPQRIQRSPLEVMLAYQMDVAGIVYQSEVRFDPKRRWRIDFAVSEKLIAIETEGGHWIGGRHVRGAGFEADCEKYNALALAGWRLLRFTGNMIKSGVALRTIERALA